MEIMSESKEAKLVWSRLPIWRQVHIIVCFVMSVVALGLLIIDLFDFGGDSVVNQAKLISSEDVALLILACLAPAISFADKISIGEKGLGLEAPLTGPLEKDSIRAVELVGAALLSPVPPNIQQGSTRSPSDTRPSSTRFTDDEA